MDIIIQNQTKSKNISEGTVKRSSITCPICNFTTAAPNVRNQFLNREGGVKDAQLIAVVTSNRHDKKRFYRVGNIQDIEIVENAKQKLVNIVNKTGQFSLVPDETLPYLRSIFNVNLLGVKKWGQLFTPRQALHLSTFARIISNFRQGDFVDEDLAIALATCLGIALDKMADFHTSLTTWISKGEKVGHTFGRQALA